jgi:Fe-S-cluster-containing dehydrogenase component/DMSO reductase anchor subunit
MTRLAFVFDQKRCTGCHACRLACTIENGLPFPESWRQIVTFNPRHETGLPSFHLSLACNHCAGPACMHACPARAYRQDAATGAVVVDESKCIGCRYCTWACPYDAPRFDARRGVVTKCTFCVERLHEGGVPACADYCPTGALTVARCEESDLTTSAVGFPEGSALRPAIRIVPWPADTTRVAEARPPFAMAERSAPPSKITLRSEWSLVVFTFVAAALVGLFAGHVLGPLDLGLVTFVGIAVPAMGLSALHLGRKERAWRAVLGLRRSWLSREIVAFSAFVSVGALHFVYAPSAPALGPVGIVLGTLALIAMDRVYGVVRLPAGARPHSSSVVLTGMFVAGVVAVSPVVAGAAGALKLAFYLRRKVACLHRGESFRPVVSALRIGLTYVLPATLLVTGEPGLWWIAFGSVLAGEFIDRCEFYTELSVPTPAGQMAADLARTREASTAPAAASRAA